MGNVRSWARNWPSILCAAETRHRPYSICSMLRSRQCRGRARRAWHRSVKVWPPLWLQGWNCHDRSDLRCWPRWRGTSIRSRRVGACWPRPWRHLRSASGEICARRPTGSRASGCCAKRKGRRANPSESPRRRRVFVRPLPWPKTNRPNPGNCGRR
jgi:hypothetical protein